MKLQTLRLRRYGLAVFLLAVLTTLVVACGPQAETPEHLAQDQQILKTCPAKTKLASKLDLDVSGSRRTPELGSDRTAVVASVARRTAICGGHLQVSAFSVTSAATVNLYDDALTLSGATDTARLRGVQKLVDDLVKAVTDAYPPALKKLSPNGSDILAQYRLAAEYADQLGGGYQLDFILLTDGYQAGSGISLGGGPLTQVQANALAAKVNVPKLPKNTFATVSGLGKVATGKPAPSVIVEGVVRFWNAICARSGAGHCVSVTDYTTADR